MNLGQLRINKLVSVIATYELRKKKLLAAGVEIEKNLKRKFELSVQVKPE